MTAATPRSGRIVTFYSYKGGTGRSMAVANVAWILASNGHRVLMIDWDVEAPGLHRYLHPFLLDPELVATDGVVDWVTNFVLEAMTQPEGDPDPDWFRPLADLSRYAVSADWPQFPRGATLDLVPAGRQGPDYATKVNGFDWHGFYERFGGGAFLEEARRRLRASYDYVLIDSRTGVSDTSGICTVALPDSLAVCFTLNAQSIEGAAAVAESVLQSRGEADFAVFPVPMRVELGEKDRLDQARDHAHTRFERFLASKDRSERQRYWGEVEVLYEPYYAYEEVLAVFRDRPGQTASVLGALERLTAHLTGGRVGQLVPPSERERLGALRRYQARPGVSQGSEASPPVGRYAFISYSEVDGGEFASRLAVALAVEPPVTTWVAARDLQTGMDWQEQIERAIRSSSVLLFVVSSGSTDPKSSVALELDTARRLAKPVIALRVHRDAAIPRDIAEENFIDFSSDFQLGVASLRTALRRLESPQGRLTTLVRRRRDAERDLGLTTAPAERTVVEEEIRRLDGEIRELEAVATGLSPETGSPWRTFRVTVDGRGRVTGRTEGVVASAPLDMDDLRGRTIAFMRVQARAGRLWPQDLELLGTHVYRALFPTDVGLAFESSLQTLRPSEKLRLELDLEVPDERLLWEFLYVPARPDRSGFFAGMHGQFAMVREAPDQRRPPRPPAGGPLRIVLAESPAPATTSVAEMLVGIPGLNLRRIAELAPSSLIRMLRDGADILHLAVHASGDMLMLGTAAIGIATLAQQLSSEPPRLVFLQSPDPANAEEADALVRLPATLLDYGVDSVVCVAEPIFSANGIRGFVSTFYGSLAMGLAVDEAAQRARGEVGLLASDVPAQLAEFGSFRVYCSGPEPPVLAPAPAAEAIRPE